MEAKSTNLCGVFSAPNLEGLIGDYILGSRCDIIYSTCVFYNDF